MRKTKGEEFDPEIHVSRFDLAARYEKRQGTITRAIRKGAVVASGMIIDRRPGGNVDVPFWEAKKVIPLLDKAFGLASAEPAYKGEIVKPAEVRKFKPLSTKKHPRREEIDKAQPRLNKGIKGVGVGHEMPKRKVRS